MKAKKWLFAVVLLLCCAAFGTYRVVSARGIDREAPQITMDAEEISLPVSGDRAALLHGVTAHDAQDGDVTDSLLVESVRGVVNDGRFTVTYAAFDAAGNVAKAQRTVFYEDYTPPRFSLERPLIFRSGSVPDVFAPLHANDVFDGDITGRIKGTLVSGGQLLTEAGDYVVEFRVSNSLGDTAWLTAPVRLVDGWSGTQLALTEYLVYLPCGAEFVPEAYVEGLSIGMRRITPESGELLLAVESDVNTAQPGVYCVDYTAEYGAQSASTRLLVVVEEQA